MMRLKKNSQRIYEEVVPELEELRINYRVTKNEKGVRFSLGDYRLHLGGKTGDRYTLTIWSKIKSSEEAIEDFPGSQELSAHSTEESDRRARIPLASFNQILDSIKHFSGTINA